MVQQVRIPAGINVSGLVTDEELEQVAEEKIARTDLDLAMTSILNDPSSHFSRALATRQVGAAPVTVAPTITPGAATSSTQGLTIPLPANAAVVEVEKDSGSGWVQITDAHPGGALVVRDLLAATPYSYRARGVNDASNGPWSAAVTATTASAATPAPTATTVAATDTTLMKYTGTWQSTTATPVERYVTATPAEVSFKFTGTGFFVRGTRDAHHGTADVYVDGVKVGSFSETATTREAGATVYTSAALASGEHTVRLVVTTATVALQSVGVYGAPIAWPVASSLWTPSDANWASTSVATALSTTQVDTSDNRPSLGAMVADTTSPDGTGRALELTIPVTTDDTDRGYRAMTDLTTRGVAGFPAKTIRLSYAFKIVTLGSWNSNRDSKFGYGLAGAAQGTTMGGIASGNDLDPGTFYWRVNLSGAGDAQGGLPLTLNSYVYALNFAGQAWADNYGLRNHWRRPDGTYCQPIAGRWHEVDLEFEFGTAGQTNGRARSFFDGVKVEDVAARWVDAAYPTRGVSILYTAAFANDPFTSQAKVRWSKPVLSSL
ncbi:hypothetical protein GCM10027586_00690 [Kineococcus gypseus]|uniref:hypothetical protein n=1 Tax=Kineococcus gypseus TaxID=1637102 RepID=UPI003D7DCCE3